MTPERWQQVKQIFQSVLDCPPDERNAFLARACKNDHMLRAEVESLISSYDEAGTQSIEDMAAEVATEVITDGDRNLILGGKIAHYEVLSQLGRGGMGEVYLAQDSRLGRKVALKFLPASLSADDRARKRLIKEAQAAAKLDHPNICTIYEVGQQDGLDFIAMQYVEGETLACRIERKPLEIKEVLNIATQVADALAEAHSHAIIHRDIKPANIMITSRRQVKVMDFGLAKAIAEREFMDSQAPTESLLSEPGMILGTLPYMSPEQVRGEAVDARSDIFSFGVMLYEMASGHKSFAAESAAATISAILTREPPPLARFSPEAPAELERIVTKALRKDREERYQGIKDLALDLKNLKEQLEFEAKLERSRPPDVTGEGRGISTAGSGLAAVTSPKLPASTGEIGGSKAGSSTRPFPGAISKHKWAAAGILALVLTVSAAAFLYFNYFNRAQALTERDAILLADIVNTTGDPVFDGTLKQALEVQLGQSPFFNIFPEQRVRETLRYMARSPDERVTKEIGREICQREGIKALLVGSIASLGSHYVITLETLNGQTGDALAREQVEAESKEQVISKLGEASTKLREKLGESLSSIQKFDAPIERATTSSLEAFRAYTLALEQHYMGKNAEAIPLLKRAVELDPDFAAAYALLAVVYSNEPNPPGLAKQAAAKAFELRERATEREEFDISSLYYTFVTKELDKDIEVMELIKQTYPRDFTVRNNLANGYLRVGQYEKATEELSESIRLNPNAAVPYSNLGFAYRALGRYGEAKATIEQARARNFDDFIMHWNLDLIAFAEGDQTGMQRYLEWASGKPYEFYSLEYQGWTEMFAGRYRRSLETSRRAAESAQSQDLNTEAARIISTSAAWGALVGDYQRTREGTAKALAIARDAEPPVSAALALALCGEVGRAQSILDDLARRNPTSTVVNAIWGPVIRAAIEMDRGDHAEAIRQLQKAKRYEMGQEALFWPTFMRGQAYLRQGSAAEAIAEFQKIIERRGVSPADPLYPLASLGLARAAASAGDTDRSRKAYEDFFALWKDADPDLPILIEAKKEYEKLR